MIEDTKDRLKSLINEYDEKIHQKENELRNKQVQRERIEAELVSIKGDLENLEKFKKEIAKLLDSDEDKIIEKGIKSQRSLSRPSASTRTPFSRFAQRRGRKASSESVGAGS